MTLNLDRMSYLIISGHRDGAYLPERNLCDTDRKSTIKDIADGQYEDIVQVLECNPVEGICRDVTEDILAEADDLLDPEFKKPNGGLNGGQWDHARGWVS